MKELFKETRYDLSAIIVVFLFSLSLLSHAQQNLFNVPSGDITPIDQGFYQHQINFYSCQLQESKVHLTYGLGKNWDIGINLVDLPIIWNNGFALGYNDDPQDKPLYPVLMATAQKQWTLTEKWAINLGTQIGPNLARGGTTDLSFWNYAGIRYHITQGFLIGGLYQSGPNYIGGNEDHVGYWLGYEYHLTERWFLMGDLISGRHKKSSSTIGIVYNLSNKVQLCLARLFSFPGTSTPSGFVLEVNVFTYKYLSGLSEHP